jgi:hypothetical protein
MKKNKNRIKHVSLLLSILIVFQGCTVYKSANTTLDEAVKNKIKTKLETNNGVNFKFKKIVFENDNYFGVRKVKGKTEKMQLNEKHINNIKLKDKALSTVLTIALPITVIAASVLIFQDNFKWKSGSFFEGSDFTF